MSFLKSLFKGMLGMDDSAEKAARAQARRAEEELRKAQEAQKLQAANEMQRWKDRLHTMPPYMEHTTPRAQPYSCDNARRLPQG